MKLRRSIIAVLFTLALSLIAAPATFAQNSNAQVRVIHASPDAPAVDVYVDDDQVLTNVPFFTASDYLDLPAGTYRLRVTPTGSDLESAVIDANATVAAGNAYTVAATGLVANIQPTIIADDNSAPASGQAKVRVHHFSPDAPAVDVKLADGTTLISNLAFTESSDYLEVDAGSYDLQVTPDGANDVVIDLSGTRLEAGKIYDVFATGELDSITPEVVVTTPAAPVPATDTTATTPQALPTTAEGDTAPVALLIIGALMLVGVGAFVLRRYALR